MSTGYTKLFSSIITSTIWTENDATRIVWITMLATANKNGEIQASIPGLARIAGVSVEACEEAIQKFLSPDKHSRTKDDEGRRIEEIQGGWALLNYVKYREMASKDESQQANRERQKRFYDRQHRNHPAQPNDNLTPPNAPLTQANGALTHDRDIAEAEAEAEAKKKKSTARAKLTLEEWLHELQAKPIFAGVDITEEYQKCEVWCDANQREPNRRTFANWLNRIPRPERLVRTESKSGATKSPLVGCEKCRDDLPGYVPVKPGDRFSEYRLCECQKESNVSSSASPTATTAGTQPPA